VDEQHCLYNLNSAPKRPVTIEIGTILLILGVHYTSFSRTFAFSVVIVINNNVIVVIGAHAYGGQSSCFTFGFKLDESFFDLDPRHVTYHLWPPVPVRVFSGENMNLRLTRSHACLRAAVRRLTRHRRSGFRWSR